MILSKKYPNSQGFTVVELLIVIVVIGILAAITAAAYQSVTVRAEETRLQAEISQWEHAMRQYASIHSVYPYTERPLDKPGWQVINGTFCIGNLPAKDSWDEGECEKGELNGQNAYRSSSIHQILQNENISPPKTKNNIFDWGFAFTSRGQTENFAQRGLQYRAYSKGQGATIHYTTLTQCLAGDPVGFQIQDSGSGIQGKGGRGDRGKVKLCNHSLPPL